MNLFSLSGNTGDRKNAFSTKLLQPQPAANLLGLKHTRKVMNKSEVDVKLFLGFNIMQNRKMFAASQAVEADQINNRACSRNRQGQVWRYRKVSAEKNENLTFKLQKNH